MTTQNAASRPPPTMNLQRLIGTTIKTFFIALPYLSYKISMITSHCYFNHLLRL